MAREKDYIGPITLVFKTSDRSNAQTKLKIFRNRNMDEVLTQKLPGVPDKAVILEVGVGSKFEEIWRQKYKIKKSA
jgi:hypothetical protein